MQFDITFKNPKEKNTRRIILWLVILHALIFIYLLFDEKLWKLGVAGIVVIALYSGYRALITNAANQRFSYGHYIFSIFTLMLILRNSYWLAAIELLLDVLTIIAIRTKSVYLNSYSIDLRIFPSKRYKWSDLSNVILKDNLLTIDFKNNKFIQEEIDTPVNEKEFNAFAHEQLMKNN